PGPESLADPILLLGGARARRAARTAAKRAHRRAVLTTPGAFCRARYPGSATSAACGRAARVRATRARSQRHGDLDFRQRGRAGFRAVATVLEEGGRARSRHFHP